MATLAVVVWYVALTQTFHATVDADAMLVALAVAGGADVLASRLRRTER